MLTTAHISTELQEILYVSTIAADAPIRVIADIAAKARNHNPKHHITGLLVFDGMNFCHQMEGRLEDVTALMARIRDDPRHTHVAVLHHGPLAQRRFRSFSLGYTSVEDVEALERMQHLQGQAALDAFVMLLPEIDTHD
ncbi:MAG: BLUF domain-containing protein [Polaromonas sp.]